MDACIKAWEDGETAQNVRAGTVAAEIRNVHRSKTTDKVWTWTDFFLDPNQKPKQVQPDEEIMAGFEAINDVMQAEKRAKHG